MTKPAGMSKIMYIKLESDKNPNEVIKITDRKEMEKTMIENFKQKFLEVYDTATT